MKHAVRVFFLGAALGFWASTLSALPETRSGDRLDDASRDRTRASAPAENAGSTAAVSLVEISDMAITESATLSAPFECDTSAATEDLLESAREMFLADRYELAEMLYKCLLRRDPSHVSAILELSVVYETMGKLQYAKGLLTRAEILKPNDAEIIERSIELSTKLSTALRAEVDSLVATGAYDTALPKLAMLIDAQPEDAELYYKKAQCYLALRDAEGALYDIDKALRIGNDPRFRALKSEARGLIATRDVETLARQAKNLIATGRKADSDRALPIVGEILARDPDHKWAKKQFLALTNGGSDAADTGVVEGGLPGPGGRARNLAAQAAAYAASFGRGAVSSGRAAVSFAGKLAGSFGRHLVWLIAAVLLLVVFRSPLTSMIVRGFEPRQVLSGRLGPFDINAIFSIIHAQGGRGVLHIRSGPIRGRVYFVDGEIYHCTSGKLEGRDAVRRLLAQTRDGYFVLTKLPRSYKKTIDVPFSLVLMDLGEKSFLGTPSAAAEGSSAAPRKKSKMKSLLENKA